MSDTAKTYFAAASPGDDFKHVTARMRREGRKRGELSEYVVWHASEVSRER